MLPTSFFNRYPLHLAAFNNPLPSFLKPHQTGSISLSRSRFGSSWRFPDQKYVCIEFEKLILELFFPRAKRQYLLSMAWHSITVVGCKLPKL
jgi:hypothetical protein